MSWSLDMLGSFVVPSPHLPLQSDQSPPRHDADHGTLVILVATARPDRGLSPLDWSRELDADREIQALQEAFATVPASQVAIHHLPAATLPKLHDALLRHRPSILHLIAHGTSGSIEMEADNRLVHRVSAAQIAAMLHTFHESLKLVVYSSCESAEVAHMTVQEIGCAVGYADSETGVQMTGFTAAFYENIAAGESIETAFNRARSVTHGTTPVLLFQDRRQQALLYRRSTATTLSALSKVPPSRARVAQSLISAVAVALVLGLPFVLDLSSAITLQVMLLIAYGAIYLPHANHNSNWVCFCIMLLIVGMAAPVALNAHKYYSLIAAQIAHEVPDAGGRIFLYALRRGAGNISWSLPFLLFYLPYHGALRQDIHIRKIATLAGFLMHLISSVMLVYFDSILSRSFAPADGSGTAGSMIESAQRNYLISCISYMTVGFLALAIVAVSQRLTRHVLLLVVVLGILLAQIGYWFSQHHAAQLNLMYPASRVEARTVQPYRTHDGRVLVFTSSYFKDIDDELASRLELFSVCDRPQTGEFSFRTLPREEFHSTFIKVPMSTVQPGELFCARPRSSFETIW